MVPSLLDLLEPLLGQQGLEPHGLQFLVGISSRLVVLRLPSWVNRGLRLHRGISAMMDYKKCEKDLTNSFPKKVKDNFLLS